MPVTQYDEDENTTHGVSEQCQLLETLLQRLLNKDIIGLNAPENCEKPDNIKPHLDKLRQYFKVKGICNDECKVIILFNTLPEEMKFELCGQLEFNSHENDYMWIEKKLLELFNPKETKITPLVKLFACKQKPDQTIREFLAEVRVEGYKLLKNLDPIDREEHLIDAFKKGLRNKELQHALNRVEIKTLDDAYKLVKKEKKSDDSIMLRQVEMGENITAIEKLQNQMMMVQKQLSYIVAILEKTKPSYADVARRQSIQRVDRNEKMEERRSPNWIRTQPKNQQQRQQQPRQQAIQCWTCNQVGHISRFCDKNKCTTCGRFGHAAANCRTRGRPWRFRQMWDENDVADWNSNDLEDDASSKESIRTSAALLEHRNDTIEAEVHALTIQGSTRRKKNNEKKKQMPKMSARQPGPQRCKQYPQEINDLYDYIQGKRSWKKVRLNNKADTLITKTNPEKAKNKPIIRGKCEGYNVKLFLDTGAEINVIDKTFLRTLNIPEGKIHKDNKIIKCANNSKMNTHGWVTLRIGAANLVRPCKFWVVDQLFPNVIIGIRGMKDLKMAVDPANDCVWVNEAKIPLLSRVQKQSVSNQSEN